MDENQPAIDRDERAEPSRPDQERVVPETREPQEPPGTEAGNAQYDEKTLHDTGLKKD